MIRQARNAGARKFTSTLTCILLALPLLLAVPASGAELRLLRAKPALVRSTQLAPENTPGPHDSLRLNLDAGNERYELRLRPKTHLGSLASRAQNRAMAYEGRLPDRAGSWAAITRIGNRWTGIWFDGQHYYGIDSAAALAAISGEAAGAAPDSAVVFRLSDAVWEGADFTGDTRRPVLNAEEFINVIGSELATPTSLLATLPTRRLSIAFIADAELARQDGANTRANMLAQLNIVDGIFANQVGVRLQSGSETIFDAGNQPFTSTTDAQTLLSELRTYRAGSTQQRSAGLTHLMTGRNLDGVTVGIAYLDSLCSSTYSASLSEARRELSFAALIAAHEIGHVFGAPHDAESGSACESAPGGLLMAAQLNGSQTFSSCSLEKIAALLATPQARQCLAPADAADAVVEAPQSVPLALNRATDVTITVRSVGNISVNGVNLRITLPLTLTLINAAGASAACSNSSNIVDCGLGSIAPDATSSVTLRVLATTAGTTTALVRVTAANDALRSNDSTTIQLQAAEGTDLALLASADPLLLETGATTSATFVVENRGPVAVSDARLGLTIPAGLSITQQTVENTTCAAVTNGLACGPVALAAGASARVILTLRADSAGSAVILAQSSSSTPELQPANNDAEISLTVRSPPAPSTGTTGGGGGGRMPPELLLGLALWGAARARRQRNKAAQARAK